MKQEKSEKKFYGQQCQDEELTMKFRDLHKSLVNQVIAFCKENNIPRNTVESLVLIHVAETYDELIKIC